MVGLICFASLLFMELEKKFLSSIRKRKAYFITVVFFLFILHPTIDRYEERIEFRLPNATYYNIASGKFVESTEFQSIFYPRYYLPLVDVIKSKTELNDIVSSNNQ